MAKKKKQKRQVSIVVLTYNNLHFTQECLASLHENTRDYEILVIDNNSKDGTPAYLQELETKWPELRVVLNKENLGFSGGCNQGVDLAKHELICLLNNDTILLPGWLSAMKSALRKGVGIVGAKLLFPDGTIQHGGVYFPIVDQPFPHFRPNHRFFRAPGSLREANRQEEVAGVTAGCLLTTKSVWHEVGGLDERYVKANYEDVDFNLKVREAGYKVIYQPSATLIHFAHGTIDSLKGTEEDPMQHWEGNLALLNERWCEKLADGLASVGPGDKWAPSETQRKRAVQSLTLRAEKMLEPQARSDFILDSGIPQTGSIVRLPSALPLAPRPGRDGLRILLTNHHLYRPGGSETWTYTMADALDAEHEVSVFTLYPGPFAERFRVPVLQSVADAFDLILANHNTCLEAVAGLSGFKIMTCHGTWPWQEQPIPGADCYVAISEEVQEHLSSLGYTSSVIRNGIDCERFRPEKPIASRLGSVLSLCQGAAARDAVAAACARRGIEFDYLHVDRKVFDVETYINRADLVVGLGRGVYEAMACGRAALIYDSRSYAANSSDGLVKPETIEEQLRFNMSGRAFGLEASPDFLDSVLDSYDAEMGVFNRSFAEEHLNARIQGERYLQLYQKIAAAAG